MESGATAGEIDEGEGLGFLCKITDSRHFERIQSKIGENGYFTDRVLRDRVTIRLSDLAIVIAPDGTLAYAAHVRPAKTGSTGTRGFKAAQLVELDIREDEIEPLLVHSSFWEELRLAFGGPAHRPKKQEWAQLWDAIKKLRPAQKSQLETLEKLRFDDSFEFDEAGYGAQAFFEKDAVGISLDMAGISFSSAFADVSGGMDSGKSLVQSLCGNSTEDIKIAHDVTNFPGYIKKEDVGHAVLFESGNKRLAVFNVNRRRAEAALGVDLIYRNERYNCFVFIQYKMLDPKGSKQNPRWTYRPDGQFEEERRRMLKFRGEITKKETKASCRNYRLSKESMYFKFCKRQHLKLNAGLLAHGYYLALRHLNLVLKENPGGRGGAVLALDTMDRWMTRSQFAALVANGWIGTAGLTDDELSTYIDTELQLGKSIVVAEGSDMEPDDEYGDDII